VNEGSSKPATSIIELPRPGRSTLPPGYQEGNSYISDWNEKGPQIGSGPSDEYLHIALVHNFSVMADLLVTVLQYFDIDRPDLLETLQQTWSELDKDRGGEQG
jgi:hypothetical protein